MSQICVYFPWLHPKLEHGVLPDGVVFFDPGVHINLQFPRWNPGNLPLTTAEVQAHIRNYQDFGGRFSRVADMQTYQAMGLHDFYTDTSMDIRSQLTGAPKQVTPTEEDLRRQAQLILALALVREEQIVAMNDQKNRFAEAQTNFIQALGLEDSRSEPDLATQSWSFQAENVWPWPALLGFLLRLLPKDIPLFATDPNVLEALMALGLSFNPCAFANEELLSTTLDAATLKHIGAGCFEPERFLVLMTRSFNP